MNSRSSDGVDHGLGCSAVEVAWCICGLGLQKVMKNGVDIGLDEIV